MAVLRAPTMLRPGGPSFHEIGRENEVMMATQVQIDAARRLIEQLRDHHVNDVIALVRLVDDGALKGTAGDQLAADLRMWDRGFKDRFARALSLLDSLQPTDSGKGARSR